MTPEQRCCLSPGSPHSECRYPACRGKVEIGLPRPADAMFTGFALNTLGHLWLNLQGTA